MSMVTGLILVVDICDGEEYEYEPSPFINKINAWLKKREFGPLADQSNNASGTKHPQNCIFFGGYNYFPEDDFAKVFLSIAWEMPENAVLIMQPEEGATRVFRPRHRI